MQSRTCACPSEEDKLKILSAIAGEDLSSVRGQELLETNLLRANNTLHSTIAVLAWPQAMQRGLLTEMQLATVLAQDTHRERLELSLAHFEQSCSDQALRILGEGLPPNLRELRLSFEGCAAASNQGEIRAESNSLITFGAASNSEAIKSGPPSRKTRSIESMSDAL